MGEVEGGSREHCLSDPFNFTRDMPELQVPG